MVVAIVSTEKDSLRETVDENYDLLKRIPHGKTMPKIQNSLVSLAGRFLVNTTPCWQQSTPYLSRRECISVGINI